MIDFVKARQIPFIIISSHVTLHSIVTNVAIANTIKARLLKTYQAYRNERFDKKSTKLAPMIHRVNLSHSDPQSSSRIDSALTTVKIPITSAKEVASAQREIKIVKERGKTMMYIPNHDLLGSISLFENGTVPRCTKPDKSQLRNTLKIINMTFSQTPV